MAEAKAMAMAARLAAMADRLAAMADHLAAMADRPVQLPLGVATLGTRAAQAGMPEVKPAHVPAALAATEETRRLMTCESGVAKTAKSVVEGLCRIEGRGGDHPPHPLPATTPPHCATSGFFWQLVL
jgi:hypothetical protein